jgi:uncharacterized peroxidase-related enzyme
MAMAQGFTKAEVQAILEDVRSSRLIEETAKALLIFSERMTQEPARISPEDIEALRRTGLSDEAILEGIHVIALFNSMDRLADALGTPVENFQDMMAGQG